MKVHVKGLDRFYCVPRCGGHEVPMDQPRDYGEGDKAPEPVARMVSENLESSRPLGMGDSKAGSIGFWRPYRGTTVGTALRAVPRASPTVPPALRYKPLRRLPRRPERILSASRAQIPRPWVAITMMWSLGWTLMSWTKVEGRSPRTFQLSPASVET